MNFVNIDVLFNMYVYSSYYDVLKKASNLENHILGYPKKFNVQNYKAILPLSSRATKKGN